MDQLDRLYRRLVHNVRATTPELLGRSFEVSQIYQQLIPYRTNRRELEFAANDEYELALCQLLSGARGLLLGDSDMQNALRRELESPNPDLSAYRSFATSAVSLAPDQLRAVMLRPTPEQSIAVHSRSHPSPVEQAALAGRPTEQVDTPLLPDPDATAPSPVVTEPRAPVVSSTSPVHPFESPMPVARPNPVRASPGESCRFCGGGLPDGRSIVFCPGCGHNLTIKHCPACNTELEVGWKFCITCGREI